MTLLPHRRHIAADATEALRTGLATKAARNLLLYFHHPQVSLSQIVIKRHPNISHEAQGFSAVLLQAIQQILGFALFLLAALAAGWRLLLAFYRHALTQQPAIALYKALALAGRKRLLAGSDRTLDGGFDFDQQPLHFSSPQQLLRFCQEGQLTQMMGITQGVPTSIAQIRLEAIVDGDAAKLRQDADGFTGPATEFVVVRIVSQLRGGGDVQPLPFTGDIKAGFI